MDFGTVAVNRATGFTMEHLAVREYFNGLEDETSKPLNTIPFLCRRCRPARNIPLKRSTLDEICRRLMAEDTPELDLSALGSVDALR